MTGITYNKDIGDYLYPVEAVTITDHTTASAATNGTAFDRTSLTNVFLSGKVIVNAKASLIKAKKATYTWKVQHSPTTTAWSDLTDKDGNTNQTINLGSTLTTASQTAHAIGSGNYRFSNANQYLRVVITQGLTVGSSVAATGRAGAVFVFGGGYATPAR